MPRSTRPLLASAGFLLGLGALALACSKPAPPPPAPAVPVRVENAALGLAFDADLKGVAATVTVGVGAPEAGPIGLVDRANAFGAEARQAGGKFHGGNELVTPFGSATTVRATVEGGQVEERRVLMLYPRDPRCLLTFVMRYPPGDAQATRDRLVQLMELLGAMEIPSGS